ncbi:NUDIX domain-containing protein [Stappia sp. F7233]|uniref:NUDIX domain-containing protein n=1 Tax=Stappia albiluteola TaxID=2758565 RepID=A0A839AFQ6_9HYPH|nr:NUDIX domain-containing protein [Stappia albiluteola]MBA5778481.1 NUDIX domain-containing protein [Stappia albiluteola]
MDEIYRNGVVCPTPPLPPFGLKHKAYIYLTCGSKLLVFAQPDEPDVGLQVPGGTLDPGESYLHGARREFAEETGLALPLCLDHLGDQDVLFDNAAGRDLHRRRLFHARTARIDRQEWEHFEMTPSAGGDPIRFRLFWIDLFDDLAHDENAFFAGFAAPLGELRRRIGRA